MSQYVADQSSAVEIQHRDQLIEFFTTSAKPAPRWRIGTEYEKVAVQLTDGRAVPFSGSNGIERLLRELSERYAWEPVLEEGRVVALRGSKAWVTLEPGGQVELSGELCENVHCNRVEFARHVDEIVSVGGELDIAFLGLGMQPVSRVPEIEQVPKRRYGIMAPHMQRVGSMGLRMMRQTAGVQVNLDYSSEADAMMKMRVAMGLTPLFVAMFANSPISDGDLNGYLSFRGHVWTDTDRARCGMLPFVFHSDAGFEHYVECALDVPMYFIVRDGQWFDMTAFTFRHFLENGHHGHRATLDDWAAHLTTLFFEVRLKKYLEVRCFDSQPPELMLAVPALVKGVLYEQDCLLAAWDLIKGWSWEERVAAYHDAQRKALHARVRRYTLADLARELLDISTQGLERQRCLNAQGEDESIYLERLRELVQRGLCPAEHIVELWHGFWNGDIRRLVEGTKYPGDFR